MNITPEFLPEAFSGKRRRISHVTGNAYVGMLRIQYFNWNYIQASANHMAEVFSFYIVNNTHGKDNIYVRKSIYRPQPC